MKKCFKKPVKTSVVLTYVIHPMTNCIAKLGRRRPDASVTRQREDFATLRCGARADAMLLVRMLTSVAVLVATLVNSCVAEQDPQFKKEELEALLRAERTLKPPLHTP